MKSTCRKAIYFFHSIWLRCFRMAKHIVSVGEKSLTNATIFVKHFALRRYVKEQTKEKRSTNSTGLRVNLSVRITTMTPQFKHIQLQRTLNETFTFTVICRILSTIFFSLWNCCIDLCGLKSEIEQSTAMVMTSHFDGPIVRPFHWQSFWVFQMLTLFFLNVSFERLIEARKMLS